MKKWLGLFLSLTMLLSMLFIAGCQEASTETTPEGTTTQSEATEPDETDATDPDETEPAGTETEPEEMTYSQSPYLDGLDLPPVEERLPEAPKIANEMPAKQIVYEIGQYGGTLRTVSHETGWDAMVFCMQNEPLLNTPGLLAEEVTGNIVQDYEVSADQKEFTFYMRKGLKWSDGVPVTIEDVRFTVEDILFNEVLQPAGIGAWLKSAGKPDGTPFTFEIIDDWTFKISFDEPYGGFLLQLSLTGWRGYTELVKPAHYLKQFHVDYTPLEDLEPLIEESGFEPGAWNNLFNEKDVLNWSATNIKAIGFPVLTPYVQVSHNDSEVIYERNPYYHKIDEEGNQLPYIDKIQTTYVQDLAMISMKVLAGEVDHSSELIAASEIALFKENAESAGYKITSSKLHRTGTDIFLNMTYEDPVWREVVRDVRFRQALSHALNRAEIIETVDYGFSEPSLIQAGSDFNLDKANQILDDMGMTVGSDGFRRSPSGEPFSIEFEVSDMRPQLIPTAQLAVEHWRMLDLDVSFRQIGIDLWSTRNAANELKATILWSSGPVMPTWPDWGNGLWGPLWSRWYNSNGEQGEEPPAEVLEFYRLVTDINTKSLDESADLIAAIRKSLGDNLWFFLVSEDIVQFAAVNEKMQNLNDNGFNIAHFMGVERWYYAD